MILDGQVNAGSEIAEDIFHEFTRIVLWSTT